jgi:hypothetical protein
MMHTVPLTDAEIAALLALIRELPADRRTKLLRSLELKLLSA